MAADLTLHVPSLPQGTLFSWPTFMLSLWGILRPFTLKRQSVVFLILVGLI